MLEDRLFQQALPVLEALESAGYEAYFVGGCVRDTLLQQPISDVDIATSAFPEEIKKIFKRTIDVGIEHGTVMVLLNQLSYEVTTFRTESTYQDYRRPDKVTFVRSLEEDLKRRDFTINALALDRHGRLYDFHQGQMDLKKRVVRAVGNASERFNEDALRMMRAVRFLAQLGFEIDEHTRQGIQQHAHLLEKIAIERICIEWEKLMASSHRHQCISAFLQTDLYQYCPWFKGRKQALQLFLSQNIVLKTEAYNWAILLYYCGIDSDQCTTYLKQWKLSNKVIDTVKTLLSVFEFRQQNDWSVETLFHVGDTLSCVGEKLAKQLGIIDKQAPVAYLYEQLPIKSIKDLALNGSDIMVLLNKQSGGRYLGHIIETIKLDVLHGRVDNTKQALSDWVIKYFSES